MNTVWSKYRVEFGILGGLMGVYIGDTIEELYKAIDSDKRLANDESLRDMLKYGYFWEFKDKPYKTNDYDFMWTVR